MITWYGIKITILPRDSTSTMTRWGLIYNGNWIQWSAIWTEINRVITKSNDREVGVRFIITSLISVQNCTTRSSISTLLYSFWNFKHFCKPETVLMQKTHLWYLPECCSIATIKEQDEVLVLLNRILLLCVQNTAKMLQYRNEDIHKD
jgi:hypothetical protein